MADRICMVPSCDTPRAKRDWCDRHYRRWMRTGDPEGSAKRRSPEERFWAKVEKSDTCWEWQGARKALGYGHLNRNGEWKLAHRYAYELVIGPIPEGLQIDHLCCNTSCVNPDHLEPVTPQENRERALDRRTRCKKGHSYTPENTRIAPNGRRQCRTCDRLHARRRRATQPKETRVCSESGCSNQFYAFGKCRKHRTLDKHGVPYLWKADGNDVRWTGRAS